MRRVHLHFHVYFIFYKNALFIHSAPGDGWLWKQSLPEEHRMRRSESEVWICIVKIWVKKLLLKLTVKCQLNERFGYNSRWESGNNNVLRIDRMPRKCITSYSLIQRHSVPNERQMKGRLLYWAVSESHTQSNFCINSYWNVDERLHSTSWLESFFFHFLK